MTTTTANRALAVVCGAALLVVLLLGTIHRTAFADLNGNSDFSDSDRARLIKLVTAKGIPKTMNADAAHNNGFGRREVPYKCFQLFPDSDGAIHDVDFVSVDGTDYLIFVRIAGKEAWTVPTGPSGEIFTHATHDGKMVGGVHGSGDTADRFLSPDEGHKSLDNEKSFWHRWLAGTSTGTIVK
jgi:hypothetical protein